MIRGGRTVNPREIFDFDVVAVINEKAGFYRVRNKHFPDWEYVVRETKSDGVGRAYVYAGHNEFLGVCYFPDYDFVTPNMPKLPYAMEFKIDGLDVKPIQVHPELRKMLGNHDGYAFIKRDGFNLLFYKHPNGKIVPKTRLMPITGQTTRTLIEKEFPDELMKSIENAVNDGYIPIFEVWGEKLGRYGIIHGGTDVARVKEIEGIKEDPVVELIAVRKNEDGYPFLSAREMIKFADEYGLNHAPLYRKGKFTFDDITGIMDEFEERNKASDRPIYEGIVIHIGGGHRYRMFKVKPWTVMKKDVVLKNLENSQYLLERIDLEVSKVINEFTIDDLLFDGWSFALDQLREYLSEDIKVNRDFFDRKIMPMAIRELSRRVAEIVLNNYPEYCEKIPARFRELKAKGYYLTRAQKRLINRIMGECRKLS